MPIFEFDTPSGGYEIEAPNVNAALEAFKTHAMPAAPQQTEQALKGAPFVPDQQAGEEQVGLLRQMATGVPILGGYLDKVLPRKDLGDRFAQDHPNWSMAANVAGAGATLLPLGGTALGARALGLTGSLPARFAAGTTSGAAIGAADSAVRGQNPGAGAVIGGTFGAAAPAVGRLVGKGVEAAIGVVRPAELSAAGRGAINKVGRALTDDAVTPELASQRFGQLGPEGMLADMGPNLRGQAEAVASLPGPGQRIVSDAVNARAAGTRGRLEGSLDEALGPRVNMAETTAAMESGRREAAAPLYERFHSTPIPLTQTLVEIAQLPSVKEAIPRAARMATDEGRPILDAAGNPTALTWDYLKRAMDDTSRRAGYGTNEARIASGISRRIAEAIDNHPDKAVAGIWRDARRSYAEPTAVMEAMETGQKLMRPSARSDQLAMALKGMSDPERQGMTQGVRDAIARQLEGSARGDTTAREALRSAETQAKIRALAGDDKAAKLATRAEAEKTFGDTRNAILGNSRTAARQAAQKEFGSTILASDLHTTLPGVAIAAARRIASAILGARTEQQAAEVARMLTRTGSERDAMVNALLNYGSRRQIGATAGAAVDKVATALISGSHPATTRRAVAP